MKPARQPVLDDVGLGWAQRGVWLMCVAVYLTVFVSGIQDGGDELMTVARAIGFTLVAGFLGKQAVGLLSRASLPVEQGQSTDQPGPLGSLAEPLDSTNVANQEDWAELETAA